MNALDIILKYYPADTPLRRLLLHHSRQVQAKALDVCLRHPELGLDRQVLSAGALLHDIGICQTDAPGIHCHGRAHYMLHGPLGAAMVRGEAAQAQTEGCEVDARLLEACARICERHTGTGLRREAFARRGLTPPPTDLLPETLEEQVVCYADKFFSKSHPDRERTAEQTAQSLEKFGAEGVKKFLDWHARFA